VIPVKAQPIKRIRHEPAARSSGGELIGSPLSKQHPLPGGPKEKKRKMRDFIDSKNSRGRQKYFAPSRFIVGILVTAAGFSTAARAADVTITTTGVVFPGSIDKTGVFFPGKTNTDLTEKPCILTFTFDNTLGTEKFTASQSYIKNTATSNPGTAVLQIGGGQGSFGFGTPGYSPYASEAYLTAGLGGSYSLQAADGSYGGNWNNIQGTISPATRTALTENPSWEAAFSDADLYVSPLQSNNYSLTFRNT
jgi:hypothetical protein